MSDSKIYPIRADYIKMFPALYEMVIDRGDVRCYGLRTMGDFDAVILVTKGIIYHVHVKEDARHAGIGTELVKFAIEHYSDDNGQIRAAVRPDDAKAVCMFVKAGFQIRGFEVTWGDNRYNMVHGGKSVTFKGVDPWQDAIDDLEKLADYLYVVEMEPVHFTRN